jgi:hypothetical protein
VIFFDTETCGLHGPTVLIQWARNDGPIHLHSVWSSPISETLKLIEEIANEPDGVVGFNLAFDWFHLCQTYTCLLALADKVDIEAYPEDYIEEYSELEAGARDGPCLKPVSACDLMLHARKGPYQSTMERGDIRIRRVSTALAWQLAGELERRIPLKDIYFARKKDKNAPRWNVHDIKDEFGDIHPDFKDIVLKFAPSSALKALAVDALGVSPSEILLFSDVGIHDAYMPEESGFAPFYPVGNWPKVIEQHIDHWNLHTQARAYAEKDVELTRRLYNFFDKPQPGDDDSELACMVGAVRWKGFKIDVEGIKALRQRAIIQSAKTPTAPEPARRYIMQALDVVERAGLQGGTKGLKESTKKTVLETIRDWPDMECPSCNATGEVTFGDFKPVTEYNPDELDNDADYAAAEMEDATCRYFDCTIKRTLRSMRW